METPSDGNWQDTKRGFPTDQAGHLWWVLIRSVYSDYVSEQAQGDTCSGDSTVHEHVRHIMYILDL